MSDCGDSDEKAPELPALVDMLREIKRKPDEAGRLLAKWLGVQWEIGHGEGLNEGLRRGRERARITTLDDLSWKRRALAAEQALAEERATDERARDLARGG
jgi:hypothetical protein